jgi:hypothetical protein
VPAPFSITSKPENKHSLFISGGNSTKPSQNAKPSSGSDSDLKYTSAKSLTNNLFKQYNHQNDSEVVFLSPTDIAVNQSKSEVAVESINQNTITRN